MQRKTPPFRADHVGSILRSGPIKDARAKRAAGKIDAAELKAVEDREIETIIRKQEEVGLQSITDGEFRRAWWHLDFLEGLDGAESYEMPGGVQFHGVQTKPMGVRTVGKLGFSGHPMIEHFKFVQAHTKRTPKMAIPMRYTEAVCVTVHVIPRITASRMRPCVPGTSRAGAARFTAIRSSAGARSARPSTRR